MNWYGIWCLKNFQEMEVGKNTESHLTSAAAFVDGGILDPCDDACSICLEEFSESDPSSVIICVCFSGSCQIGST